MPNHNDLLPIGSLVLVALLTACGGPTDIDVELQQSKVRSGPGPHMGVSDSVRFGFGEEKAAGESRDLAWDLPEGWRELESTQFRLGNFAAPDGVTCWITRLPGEAGGLLMNINRWRGEMGAAPIDEAGLAAMPKRTVLGVEGVRLDVEGTYTGGGATGDTSGHRMLAVAVIADGNAVFVKLVGPAAGVAEQERAFERLVASLRAPVPGATESASGPLRWKTPEGWVDAGQKPMRIATLLAAGREDTECTLSNFGGTLAMNINRWRQQMGQGPLDDAGLDALERVTVLGRPSHLLDVQGAYGGGMGGKPIEDATMLAVVCPLPDGTSLFVKMVGPTEVVRAERQKFLEFCESIAQ